LDRWIDGVRDQNQRRLSGPPRVCPGHLRWFWAMQRSDRVATLEEAKGSSRRAGTRGKHGRSWRRRPNLAQLAGPASEQPPISCESSSRRDAFSERSLSVQYLRPPRWPREGFHWAVLVMPPPNLRRRNATAFCAGELYIPGPCARECSPDDQQFLAAVRTCACNG
jgi:hypothetical protein